MRKSVKIQLRREKGKNFCRKLCCRDLNETRTISRGFSTIENNGEWKMINNNIRWVQY